VPVIKNIFEYAFFQLLEKYISISNYLKMKIFFEILKFTLHNASENRVFDGLSGTFRLGSRMFLVCFSFLLRSNWLPIRLEIGLEQVQSFRRQEAIGIW